jgi:hypothetical protein
MALHVPMFISNKGVLSDRCAYSHIADEESEAQRSCLFAQVHTAVKQQSQELNSVCLIPVLHPGEKPFFRIQWTVDI